MHMLMPWFIPVGFAIGAFGSRTAVTQKRIQGGRLRLNVLFIFLLAWIPTAVWMMACLIPKGYLG
jgi:hypothetical protein